MLDANRLAVLVEVAHAGSITGAADQLSLTASAVSQQLAKLERDLGCTVVHREARGVTLTAIGRVLVAHAESVVGELRTAERTVREMLQEQPLHLAVGTFASAGEVLVPEALARFRRHHPCVALTLMDLEPPDGYGLVRSRDLDLLITHRYPGVSLPELHGLQRRLLMTDDLRLVLPAGHPRSREQRLTLAQLAEEDWIAGSRGVPNRVCLDRLAQAVGIQLRVSHETRDYHVTLALIEAGLGIAFVPASVLAHVDQQRLAVRHLADARAAREIFLVHHKHPSRLVADMISQLRPQFRPSSTPATIPPRDSGL